MYESLSRFSKEFHLYIFAFDELAYEILVKLELADVTVVSLHDFETEELKDKKRTRSKAEYCWTCTPSTIAYVLENFNVPNCTYIDSDLCFYSDPAVLISEMVENKKNVLITEHHFSLLPELYELKRGGRFCVQFITFLNEQSSLKVLERWRKQCINWCYARYEDNKFGDQKYLEEWPLIYSNIHILQHQGGGIAPWNLTQYSFFTKGETVSGNVRRTRSSFEVVFFHFQYVKFLANGYSDIGWYYISSSARKTFYLPYLKKIEEIEKRLITLNTQYKTGLTVFKTDSFKNLLKTVSKKVFRYNIIKTK
jgi:hypothetical protein